MSPELKKQVIKFLIEDNKAKKNDRLNFVEYFQQFVDQFQNDMCDQEKIIQISELVQQGQKTNLLLNYFGICFRQLSFIRYFEKPELNVLTFLEKVFLESPENWSVGLSKIRDKIYYLKVSGTPAKTIATYFDNIAHRLNELEPGILELILSEYEEHILGGFGLEISSISNSEIIDKLNNPEVIKDKLKVIALIRLALMRNELTDEEKLVNNNNMSIISNTQNALTPLHTQIISLMAIAKLCQKNSDTEQQRGILAQVQTGQGKSVIIAMVAAFICLFYKERVDIITSNESLAQRDYEQMILFYQRLGLKSYYYSTTGYTNDHDVIYCTIKSILQAQATKYKKIAKSESFETRSQQCFIGDEVDQFLSKPGSSTYHPVGKELVELNWICKDLHKNRNKNVQELKELILSDFKYQQLNQNAQEFVQQNLKNYIANAKTFNKNYQINRDYIVDNGQVCYKDKISNTWCSSIVQGYCLQQFIELESDLPMSPIQLQISCISYESFIKQYERHVGLSGTIGTEEERKELKDIYNLHSFDVPRFEGNAVDSKLKILDPIVVSGNLLNNIIYNQIKGINNWMENIVNASLSASNNGQPVLIVVKQLKQLQELANVFKQKNTDKSLDILQTLQGKENFQQMEQIIQSAGDVIQDKGRITIGLEIAGRGIDIKPLKKVEQKGGLIVILGFIPKSNSDEIQIKGRTSRQSNSGEFQYILDEDSFDQQFKTQYQNFNNEFDKALDEYRLEIQKELSEKRVKERNQNEFNHQMCKEFYNNLNNINDKIKRNQIVNNWYYFLELIVDSSSELSAKIEQKNKFFNNNF